MCEVLIICSRWNDRCMQSYLCLTSRWEARTVCFCCMLLSVAVAAFLLEPVVQNVLEVDARTVKQGC